MKAELRDEVLRHAEATLNAIAEGKLKVTLEDVASPRSNFCCTTKQILAASELRRRLRNRGLWESAQVEMCNEWMVRLLDSLRRRDAGKILKAERSAAKSRQGEMFPGFEALPTRIRRGKNYLKFPDATVVQFLDYAARYERRAQVNQKTAAELRRLAAQVTPFAEIDPDITVADAFSRATFNQPKLAVTPKEA